MVYGSLVPESKYKYCVGRNGDDVGDAAFRDVFVYLTCRCSQLRETIIKLQLLSWMMSARY